MRQWPVLNTRAGWTLFNLVFISVYQNLLLLGLALPALLAAARPAPLSLADLWLATVWLALLLMVS